MSCLVVSFAWGASVGRYQVFPYRAIQAGLYSVAAVFEERATILGIEPRMLLRNAHRDGEGVTVFKPDRVAPGLTFIVGFFDNANEMRLIDFDGRVIRSWTVSFSDIFPDPQHLDPREVPQTDWNFEIHGAVLMPDGSVVFNIDQRGSAKLDRCGSIEWTLPRMTHHSIERSERGGFWIPSGRQVDDPSTLPPIPPPFREDTILHVSDQGEVLQEISVPDLFLKNGLQWLLFARMPGLSIPNDGDLTHLNDVEELGSEMAPRFPQFRAGDLLLSIRELNLIMVIDPDTETIKWRQMGPWIYQHDPDFGTDGEITVFSNNNDGTDTGSRLGGSTILAVDPEDGTTTVRYGGHPEEHMFTPTRGKHQQLENGNLLITSTEAGRAFEVDRSGETVWELINRYDEDEVAIVTQATRYPADYFTVDDWGCR